MAFRDRIAPSPAPAGRDDARATVPAKPDYVGAVANLLNQQGNGAPSAQAGQPASEENRLIVGRNIQLKGEIGACDTLVVEGRVEAAMKSRIIQTAESGVFIGEAEVDNAEIRGRFEGKLTARKRLVIHATGRVIGTVRYGSIVIEEGGRVAGDIKEIDGRPEAVQPRGEADKTMPVKATA